MKADTCERLSAKKSIKESISHPHKLTGGETSTYGGEMSSQWAKRPGSKTPRWQHVEGAKRP